MAKSGLPFLSNEEYQAKQEFLSLQVKQASLEEEELNARHQALCLERNIHVGGACDGAWVTCVTTLVG